MAYHCARGVVDSRFRRLDHRRRCRCRSGNVIVDLYVLPFRRGCGCRPRTTRTTCTWSLVLLFFGLRGGSAMGWRRFREGEGGAVATLRCARVAACQRLAAAVSPVRAEERGAGSRAKRMQRGGSMRPGSDGHRLRLAIQRRKTSRLMRDGKYAGHKSEGAAKRVRRPGVAFPPLWSADTLTVVQQRLSERRHIDFTTAVAVGGSGPGKDCKNGQEFKQCTEHDTFQRKMF